MQTGVGNSLYILLVVIVLIFQRFVFISMFLPYKSYFFCVNLVLVGMSQTKHIIHNTVCLAPMAHLLVAIKPLYIKLMLKETNALLPTLSNKLVDLKVINKLMFFKYFEMNRFIFWGPFLTSIGIICSYKK